MRVLPAGRVLLAVWAGKLAALALRALGRAGTHVPGLIARRLHPGILAGVQHPPRVVVVTGTNGKTTASNLLTEALLAQGLRVASNRNGSNLAAGIAATLIGAVDWRGRSRADIAVLEMDERSAKLVLPGLAPDLLVCTNLTRDSIKRNAHPAYIAWLVSSALPASTELVLNADDLITSSLGTAADGSAINPRTHFAVDRLPTDGTRPSGAAVDVQICPVSDHLLEWDYWRYNHIGKAHCPACGFRSPDAAYRVTSVDAAAGTLGLDLAGEVLSARLINDNIVNVYNEVAVAATLDRLGIAKDGIIGALARIEPPTTRFAEETVAGVRLVRQLTKGLVGVACSRAFAYLASFPGRKAVVLTIDEVSERETDVENVAWTYDADYEYLAHAGVERIAVGGVRRHDQALRLAIAGVDPARIVTVAAETDAAEVLDLDGADAVFNLHSVHNAESTGNLVQARLRERLRASGGPR
ncbi:MurT ligase domain-containing protein [Galbitalea sp. SE-J8]|uniref:Mur ligase family protein n=1 Tax=Galbitalea sp. SE-J8 TaxID=3054952 RepID=UPI00259D11D4|nr:Mur ligase family protein [Galbitalea sp. SE-J8]MDM4763188.1 MurT ligase domain-containing protein [Galbitalea sp. SE-J8]